MHVRAEQLDSEACAVLLEEEAEVGEESGVAAAACALLSYSPPQEAACVRIAGDLMSLSQAVEAAVRLRSGVDPLRCIVSGYGLSAYRAGDCDNDVCG